jgi:hypothetical protein
MKDYQKIECSIAQSPYNKQTQESFSFAHNEQQDNRLFIFPIVDFPFEISNQASIG